KSLKWGGVPNLAASLWINWYKRMSPFRAALAIIGLFGKRLLLYWAAEPWMSNLLLEECGRLKLGMKPLKRCITEKLSKVYLNLKSMERLKDKVILVTGSTTGIGKAIAKRCVEEGARVVLHGLEEEWGESVREELGHNKTALYVEDLSQEGSAQRLVNFAVKTFGQLDVLVNNAAWVAPSNIHNTDPSF